MKRLLLMIGVLSILCLQAGNFLPVIFFRQLELLHGNSNPVRQNGSARIFLSPDSSADLLKNPGIAEHTASDHDAIGTGALQTFYSSFASGNVTVGDNGNGQMILDLADIVPVCRTGMR